MDAGIDWSWAGDKASGLSIVAAVAVRSREELETHFNRVRQECGWSPRGEFHAHECSPRHQRLALEAALELDLRVGVCLYSAGSLLDSSRWGGRLPRDLPERTALALLRGFLQRSRISRLWYDEEIKGAARQAAFKTRVHRLNRELHPGEKIKVRAQSSKHCDLVQLADVVAYGISRLARDRIVDPWLREVLEGIRASEASVIAGPLDWEG